jgi:acyl dehydratase
MSEPGVLLGERLGPFPGCLDAETIRQYAAATMDSSPLAQAGTAVPVAAVVTQIWEACMAAFKMLVSEQVRDAAAGGVHAEHDIVLHRPIRPGEPLQTWVEATGSRPAGNNALVTLRYSTFDDREELVAEQWWSTIYLGTTCDTVGEPPADHRFDDAAREHPVGVESLAVSQDTPRRYAEVSGDWADHHFTVEAAQRAGIDRPFLHGLCTMAICTQAVVAAVADGEPGRVRRVAVRFAKPAFPAENLETSIYEAGPDCFAFEATSRGALAITHGRAELRA